MAHIIQTTARCKTEMLKGHIAFDSDTFKVMLLDNTFEFSADDYELLADIEALSKECSFTGYTRVTLTGGVNNAITPDETNDTSVITWDDIVWTNGGVVDVSIGALVLYDDTHTDKPVVCCITFQTVQTLTPTSSFTITNLTLEL